MIHLTGKYYLESDENCFMLHKWDGEFKPSNDGYKRLKGVRTRYYSRLPDMFDGLARVLMLDKTASAQTLEELNDGMKEIKTIIHDLVESLTVSMLAEAAPKVCR